MNRTGCIAASDGKGQSQAVCGAGPPAAAVPWRWAWRCASVLDDDTFLLLLAKI